MKYLYVFMCLALVNCVHTRGSLKNTESANGSVMEGASNEDNEPIPPGPESEAPLKVGKNMPQYEDLSDSEADMRFIPSDFNQNVDLWINYFQGRGRHHMVRYLGRSTRYAPKMKEILRSHGLPEDLVYIALIESGFNATAYSRARASGYWQFIRGTARRYDLKIDYYVDERNDFVASTDAAARYLKALYNLFGSWYLAMASYNVGENRVKGLVMKYYTRDFWEMARMKKLPKETIHYVPKFLAARMIAKHPEKYGFTDVEYMAPLDYQELTFDKGVSLQSLSQHLGMDFEELRGLNPSYKKGIIPKYGSTPVVVRVPSKLNKEQVMAALEKSSTTIEMKRAIASSDNDFTKYKVRQGDTLSTIARRFRVSMGAIIEANDLSRRAMIRAGKVLLIPRSGSPSSSYKEKKASAPVVARSHKVRSGESLIAIANKYNVRMSELISVNKLRNKEKLMIGKVLMIPGRGTPSSSVTAKKATVAKRSPASNSLAAAALTSKKAHAKAVAKKHKIRPGESLIAIANKYNVRMSELIEANNLRNKEKIMIGKSLVIPE